MAAFRRILSFTAKFSGFYSPTQSKIALRTTSILASRSSYHVRNASSTLLYRAAIICHQTTATSSSRLSLCLSQKYLSTFSTARCINNPELLTKKTPLLCKSRSITIRSKLGKRKTCKAVAKRFHRTGKGKLKRWRVGKNHNMLSKSIKRRKQLKKPTYVSKQQLKLLNKMLNGW